MDVQHGGVTEKVPKANPPSTEKNESITEDANEQDKASVPNDVSDSKYDDGKRKNNDANVQDVKDLMVSTGGFGFSFYHLFLKLGLLQSTCKCR